MPTVDRPQFALRLDDIQPKIAQILNSHSNNPNTSPSIILEALLQACPLLAPIIVPAEYILPKVILLSEPAQMSDDYISRTIKRWAVLFNIEVRDIQIKWTDSYKKGWKDVYAMIYTQYIKKRTFKVTINKSLVNESNLDLILMHEFLHYVEALTTREDFVDILSHIIINGINNREET